MPQSGEFKIEGSSVGGQLKFAVYDSCTSTSVACGGSIALTNLVVGTKYYIKVWLEDDTNASKNEKNQSEIGTFKIRAENTSVLSTEDHFMEE